MTSINASQSGQASITRPVVAPASIAASSETGEVSMTSPWSAVRERCVSSFHAPRSGRRSPELSSFNIVPEMDEYAVYYPALMIFSQRNSPASASGQRVFSVSSASAGNRLDRWLAECLPAVSRSRIQAVIRSGGVLLNGARAKASQIVRPEDEIVWREPALTPCESARPRRCRSRSSSRMTLWRC